MKMLTLSFAGCGAALLLSLSPWSAANAQSEMTPAVAHGDWTLHQREEWLNRQLEKARDDHSLDKAAFNSARLEMRDLAHEESRMRHDGHGELTTNQTAELEARLDTVAAKIHWANMSEHTHPW